MAWLPWVASNIFLATALGLVAWFVHRRLHRPAVAHILWVLALVKLVTPPVVSVPLGESQVLAPCEQGTCQCDHPPPTPTFLSDTLPWLLLGVWSAGAVLTAWTARRRWSRFHRLTAHARPASAEWQTLATRLSADLSLRYPPEVCVVPGRLPPLVVPGRQRPRLLLPGELMGQLDEPQRAALLLHELAHLKRGDHRVRLLELAVATVYWWLPCIGVIRRQLRDCEEECCDATVVAHLPDGRQDYARLLLDVVDFTDPFRSASAVPATAMSTARALEQRLCTILRVSEPTRRAWPAVVLAAGLAAAVLPCGFRLNFVSRPIPQPKATSTTAPAWIAAETCSPNEVPEVVPIKAMCCPS